MTLTGANVPAVLQGRVFTHPVNDYPCQSQPSRSSHHEAVDSLICGNSRVTGDVPGGSGGAACIAAANAPQVVDGGGQQGPAVTAAATTAAAAE